MNVAERPEKQQADENFAEPSRVLAGIVAQTRQRLLTRRFLQFYWISALVLDTIGLLLILTHRTPFTQLWHFAFIAALFLVPMIVGLVACLRVPLPSGEIARLLDQQNGLQERIGSAWGENSRQTSFHGLLQTDAESAARRTDARRTVDLRWNALLAAALLAATVAISLFHAPNLPTRYVFDSGRGESGGQQTGASGGSETVHVVPASRSGRNNTQGKAVSMPPGKASSPKNSAKSSSAPGASQNKASENSEHAKLGGKTQPQGSSAKTASRPSQPNSSAQKSASEKSGQGSGQSSQQSTQNGQTGSENSAQSSQSSGENKNGQTSGSDQSNGAGTHQSGSPSKSGNRGSGQKAQAGQGGNQTKQAQNGKSGASSAHQSGSHSKSGNRGSGQKAQAGQGGNQTKQAQNGKSGASSAHQSGSHSKSGNRGSGQKAQAGQGGNQTKQAQNGKSGSKAENGSESSGQSAKSGTGSKSSHAAQTGKAGQQTGSQGANGTGGAQNSSASNRQSGRYDGTGTRTGSPESAAPPVILPKTLPTIANHSTFSYKLPKSNPTGRTQTRFTANGKPTSKNKAALTSHVQNSTDASVSAAQRVNIKATEQNPRIPAGYRSLVERYFGKSGGGSQ